MSGDLPPTSVGGGGGGALSSTAAAGKSILAVKLHPLVVLNISDHWTRTMVRAGGPRRVVGALLGEQNGRTLEVFTSFELIGKEGEEGDPDDLDFTYLEEKKLHYNAVFPTYEVLGWYSTGRALTPSHTVIHKAVSKCNECPVLLQMDTQPENSSTLPIWMYESSMQGMSGVFFSFSFSFSFSSSSFLCSVDSPPLSDSATNSHPPSLSCGRLADAAVHENSVHNRERGKRTHKVRSSHEPTTLLLHSHPHSVDNVAHGTGSNSISTQLRIYRDALSSLQRRVQLVQAYLEAVRDEKVPIEHSLLRAAAALCNQLPAQRSTARFLQAYSEEYSDSMLIAYLGTLTRTCATLHDVIDLHHQVHDKPPVKSKQWF